MQEVDISQLPPDQRAFEVIKLGDTNALEQLLDEYPDLVHVKGTGNGTLLHTAANYGEVKAAKLLLDRGADPDAVNDFGETPRDAAGLEGHKDIVKLLEGG
jgi:ankyrin repeat protein